MVVETEEGLDFRAKPETDVMAHRSWFYSLFFNPKWFSSLTRRIVVFNLVALVVLVSGILFLNQFRAGLIDARIQSLLTQSEIIAGAIAASATMDADTVTIDPDRMLELQTDESLTPFEKSASSMDFPINPERAAPILWQLVSPTRTRALLYDLEGGLVVDSKTLFGGGQITHYELQPLGQKPTWSFSRLWRQATSWIRQGDLPLQKEFPPEDGLSYPEVVAALGGSPVSFVRVNELGELVVIVAVPVQRFRAVLGALVMSTQGGDIDAIVTAERWAIFRVFLVAAAVTVLLSILIAGTIVEPMQRLAAAAERVRNGVRAREEIPDFTARGDEIGHLSGSLRDMTRALYDRIEAIESFAADVAHELKNPLTSLRSATETLPLAKTDEARTRLVNIIQDDVMRLDRLISDISAASRLDAELAREEMEPVDISMLLSTVASLANDVARPDMAGVTLTLRDADGLGFNVMGQSSRLGQVINNLIDNARSFAPSDSTVDITGVRRGKQVEIRIEDHGPGISLGNLERIFERFYTDRPGAMAFGLNSGLGLSISKQIISAHGGTIHAENIFRSGQGETSDPSSAPDGARFVVSLPVSQT
ncbi:Sensor histidine kinase ChvG [hydrothermal vent metagenome]|uniref:histidine kinase n=1 Tax=hydrothermal vent metagenome TaxID=652676 RepID=A0A3B0T3Y8_9ZZZZ